MSKTPNKRPMTILLITGAALTISACNTGDSYQPSPTQTKDQQESFSGRAYGLQNSSGDGAIASISSKPQVQADIQPISPAPPPQDSSGNPTTQTYLAYRYSYQFGLPADAVSETSKKHIQLCVEAGPDLCQVLRANENIRSDDYVTASLELRAQPDWIKRFRTQLETTIKDADGKILNSGVNTEDLTRAIVDTDARLNSQKILRGRLEDLVNTKDAELSDLLSLERELARVQAQIESATTTLNVYKQRVNMSIMTINYQTNQKLVTRRSVSPVGQALRNALHTFSSALGNVITFIAAVLPWMIIIVPLFWFIRRLWRSRTVTFGKTGRKSGKTLRHKKAAL